MEKSNRNLMLLTVIMGVVWISLLLSQITMTKHVFYGYREAFRIKLDVAVNQSFNVLDGMLFQSCLNKEQFKDYCHEISNDHALQDPDFLMDSSFAFLRNLKGITQNYTLLTGFVKETHSCLDYKNLGNAVIDSVISEKLHDNYIFDHFKLGFYCASDNKFFYMSQNLDAKQLVEHGIKYSVLCVNSEGKVFLDKLFFYFPDLHNRFHQNIALTYILIVLLLLILLSCFVVFVNIVIRQRKLNDFQVKMLHNITHEIKTPLTTISLASQILQDKSVQKDEHSSEEYLSMISEESKSLLSMIDEVLTAFRAQQMPIKVQEEVHLHSLLKSVVEKNKLRLGQCNAVVNYDFQAERDLVLGNPMHLANGFSNLIDNAIKYRNGDLVIQISTKVVGEHIEIRFKDNGIGIAKNDQPFIFEPFSRVNIENEHYVKGFGLGLNYLLQIIKYHKGTIKVESELSKGATFVVSLPLKL